MQKENDENPDYWKGFQDNVKTNFLINTQKLMTQTRFI